MSERQTRSEKRKEGERSRDLARRLMTMTDAELDQVTLDEDLRARVDEAREVESLKARRREERALAGYLRGEDMADIGEALGEQAAKDAQHAAAFQRVERWRETLLEDEEAFVDFVQGRSAQDADALRTAVDEGRRERDTGKPKGARKKLFRLLNDLLAKDPDKV